MKLKIFSIFLTLFPIVSIPAQFTQFEEEQFNYYWAIDKLISIKEPMLALGIEYKTPHRLSLAFDLGVGTHFPSKYNRNSSSFYSREDKNWIVLKTGIQLKYFVKRKYSSFKLNRWRRRLAKGKKVRLLNHPNRRYYVGIQLRYNPESYTSTNGSTFNNNNLNSSTGISIIEYQSASIKNSTSKIGLIQGFQQRFNNMKGYFEFGFALGIMIKDNHYYKITPPAPTSTNRISLNEESISGRTVNPYLNFTVNLGFF